jgi:hypothetical protein
MRFISASLGLLNAICASLAWLQPRVKKIKNWPRFQAWQIRRRRKFEYRHRISIYKKRLKFGAKHGHQSVKSARRKDLVPRETILAPKIFSLLKNADEFVTFLRVVDQKLRTRHVFVDMSAITDLTAEAVAVFIAVIKSIKHQNVKIGGSVPDSKVLAEKLEAFGFYDQVHRPISAISKHSGGHGTILHRESQFQLERDDTVQSEIASKMVDFARVALPGDQHKGVYTMFLEATTNTVEHASPVSGHSMTWVAGAYYDKERNVMSFTVIDRGVGILSSVKFQRALSALWGRVAWNSGEKLRQLLLGKMRSRTMEPHRGLGLPGAFTAFRAGRITDLAIICNRGFAHASKDRYTELTSAFDGTIIYWEA